MASASTITRLHRAAGKQEEQIARLPKPKHQRVKSANSADLQTDVPTAPGRLARFRVGHKAPESYILGPDQILSLISADVPPERDIAAMAGQRDLQRFARSRLRSGQRAGPGKPAAGPIAIQL
jgi:hypothetical protein